MQILFWLLAAIIFYHYLLFPGLIFLMAFISRKKVKIQEIYPNVTLIIAAYNEEKVIEAKIRNCFELDYPKDLMDVIIVSDGSTDSTPSIVNKYSDKGIQGLFQPERRGKTAALNRAVEKAKGDIIIFSDANSMFGPQSIKLLIRNFADLSVGGVCGRKSILKTADRESSRGDSLFWDFESVLKTMQSHAGSISNGDGEIFALRRSLYKEIPEKIINDDQAITFNIIKEGYRVIYEPEAISNEEASIILEDDFRVKARMVSGGFQIISFYKEFLFPPTSYFTFQFFSHKVLRYLMPFLLIFIFLTNLFLIKGIYLIFLLLQICFYSMAFYGYLLKKKGSQVGSVLYIPLYYCTMNLAAILGFYYFLKQERGVNIWKKAAR